MTSDETKRTTYHEAGHYVVLHYLLPRRWGIELSIKKKEGKLGHIVDEGLGDNPSDDEIEREIVVLYAGYASEIHCDPDCRKRARIQAGEDFEKAEDLMAALARSADDREATDERLQLWANDSIVKYWPVIEVLASELLKYKKLDGFEADCIIDAVGSYDSESDEYDKEEVIALYKYRRHLQEEGIRRDLLPPVLAERYHVNEK